MPERAPISPSPVGAAGRAEGAGPEDAARPAPRPEAPDPQTQQEITRLLRQWSGGDAAAGEELFELVYQELRQIAVGHMASERESHTLQPTALVHEAFLRLYQIEHVDWRGRKHFYALMSRVIRRVLIDYARRVGARKRGGELYKVPLGDVQNLAVEEPQRLLDLDDALTRLRELDPLQAEIVEHRFFGGLTMEEIAEATGRSPATVGRQFRIARLWLFRELEDYDRPPQR